jgi:hypothetical protein
LSTPSGVDAALSTIGYSSHILHHVLNSSPLTAVQTRIKLFILQRLGGKLAAPKPPVPSSARPAPLLVLSSLISETRYTLRLFGLVSIWTWGSSVYKSPPKDRTLKAIAYVEVLSILVYQTLENGSYLASKGIAWQTLVKRTGGTAKWSLWSVRAWFVYILLQFVRLYQDSVLFSRQEEERKKQRAEQVSAGEKTVSESEQEENETRRLAIRTWRKKLINNLAWGTLCTHWSVEGGVGVPVYLNGFISLLAGIWGTYDSWQATALA